MREVVEQVERLINSKQRRLLRRKMKGLVDRNKARVQAAYARPPKKTEPVATQAQHHKD